MSIIRSWLFENGRKTKFREETLIFSVLANWRIFPLLLECFFPECWVNEFPTFSSKVKFLKNDKNLKRLSYLMWNDPIWWYFIEELRWFYERNKEWFKWIWVSDLDVDFVKAVFDSLRSFWEVRNIEKFKELVKQKVIEELFRK